MYGGNFIILTLYLQSVQLSFFVSSLAFVVLYWIFSFWFQFSLTQITLVYVTVQRKISLN